VLLDTLRSEESVFPKLPLTTPNLLCFNIPLGRKYQLSVLDQPLIFPPGPPGSFNFHRALAAGTLCVTKRSENVLVI